MSFGRSLLRSFVFDYAEPLADAVPPDTLADQGGHETVLLYLVPEWSLRRACQRTRRWRHSASIYAGRAVANSRCLHHSNLTTGSGHTGCSSPDEVQMARSPCGHSSMAATSYGPEKRHLIPTLSPLRCLHVKLGYILAFMHNSQARFRPILLRLRFSSFRCLLHPADNALQLDMLP
jgi:hypothetical protein